MATYRDYHVDLARNLIATLGARHAIHAAEKFGWYGVTQAIADMDKASPAVDLEATLAGATATLEDTLGRA
ncbi:MAG: hypothetical protein FJX56_03100 [Alphaproteobacteria bacterium]|nr:hypothetical protein [Alphaproteobacteria bacterium]